MTRRLVSARSPAAPITRSAIALGIALATCRQLQAQCTMAIAPLNAPGAIYGLVTTSDGTIVGCGSFASGGSTFGWVAMLRNGAWQPMGTFDDTVYAVCETGGGFVIGGRFDYAGSTFLGRIARGGAGGWSPIVDAQTGRVGVNGEVWALSRAAGGLVLGGSFLSIAGHTAHRVARLQGDQFSQIGLTFGLGGSVRVVDGSNGLVAGGDFAGGIARYSASWKVIGGGTNGPVHAITYHDDQLVVGGSFSLAGGTPAANIARWDGRTWQALGSGMNQTVRALTVLPSGDLVAGGDFTVAGGVGAVRLARWNGTAWQPFTGGPNARVRALATDNITGALIPGGEFSSIAGTPSVGSALLSTTCPATATPYGMTFSCPGSPLNLAAVSLPWLGTKFTSRCSGLTVGGFAIAVFGAQQRFVELRSIYPAALPGCNGLTTLDTTTLLGTTGDTVYASHQLPNTIALVGTHLYHQVFDARFDPHQVPYGLRSSNGLDLTIGLF